MPFKTAQDVEDRIKSPDNLQKRIEHHDLQKLGRPTGEKGKEIPREIRKVIAIAAQSDSITNVANAFDISQTNTHFISKGRSSHKADPELEEIVKNERARLDNKKQDAADEAIHLLTVALGLLPEKLSDRKIKAKEVSSVAKDMAQIHETLRKKTPIEQSNITFHLHAPEQKSIDDYEIIDVTQ